ncbi:phage tail protein [Enterobacter cloacae]|uniref:phage tail protein n=1 Tax=Enterobacter cloacae TaxID=550 RepID=UPI00317EED1E
MTGQLESLTAYLLGTMPARIHDMFSVESTGGTLVSTRKNLGNGRRRIGVARQSIEISWYAYPYRDYPPAMLYALVLAWIESYANSLFEELSLPEPTFDVALGTEQRGRGDVTVSLELADELIITEDPKGEIVLDGRRWKLSGPEIWVAEEADVGVKIGRTDKD